MKKKSKQLGGPTINYSLGSPGIPNDTTTGKKAVRGNASAKAFVFKAKQPAHVKGMIKELSPADKKVKTLLTRGSMYKKGGSVHPGFKSVQGSIAKKSGVSMKVAGAILASSTRKASSKAKAINPRLNRVKGK